MSFDSIFKEKTRCALIKKALVISDDKKFWMHILPRTTVLSSIEDLNMESRNMETFVVIVDNIDDRLVKEVFTYLRIASGKNHVLMLSHSFRNNTFDRLSLESLCDVELSVEHHDHLIQEMNLEEFLLDGAQMANESDLLVCTSLVKKSSGKMDKLEFKICNKNGQLIAEPRESKQALKSGPSNPEGQVTSSFNLELTESQKMAKENVELPYTRKSEIIYTLDATEDFDEEDPDADLEI
ncbi:hypothetical protein ROZALSC1DRAFT_27119 [Rozella allomycis CSF55]|uniref:Elongator complex protein 5 n=1 Tax=Rozella allomycis (strain CSF55) TaxID=988480 RepID=A0A4P9YB27_ROZAC|nr:hypothetical protein ROZALSC1DRAFT_31589 [Rozella allomycis CSF55]RKP21477.1 hypothetical protein ROZALSC1DRAFT_27119 [Rozella allomycis CSF55]